MPSKANTTAAVFIGYMANQAFPRLGEVLKCTVLARYEKIPADKLVGTIILERLIDSITLLLVFGITLVIQPTLYTQIIETFFHQAEKQSEEKSGIPFWLITVIALVIIGVAASLWMYKKKKTFGDVLLIFKKAWQSVVQGVSSIRHLKKRKQFILLTIALWTAYISGGYLGFLALQETSHYGIREAFTVLSAGSIGMIATPGGIGAYAYMIKETMQLYGLSPAIALAFGWILWLAQTTVILMGGLISFAVLPYYNKKKIKSEKS
jgi:uncharacterized membrane protein YbhN (UPF0104 family)